MNIAVPFPPFSKFKLEGESESEEERLSFLQEISVSFTNFRDRGFRECLNLLTNYHISASIYCLISSKFASVSAQVRIQFVLL